MKSTVIAISFACEVNVICFILRNKQETYRKSFVNKAQVTLRIVLLMKTYSNKLNAILFSLFLEN